MTGGGVRDVTWRAPRSNAADRRLRASVLCVALLVSACGAAPSAEPAPAVSASRSAAAVRSVAPAATSPAPTASSSVAPSPPADAAGAVVCAKIERPRLQTGSHLIGDQPPPVPYSSKPPTSGWHSSGHFEVDVRDADDPLPEPDQVSVLEAGGVVVAYGDLPDDAIDVLGDHVRKTLDGRVAVTPYGQLDAGEVVFTTWGVLRRCTGVDLAALDRFAGTYGTDEPIEPGH